MLKQLSALALILLTACQPQSSSKKDSPPPLGGSGGVDGLALNCSIDSIRQNPCLEESLGEIDMTKPSEEVVQRMAEVTERCRVTQEQFEAVACQKSSAK
ncbi:MAG: hypothetical protein EOP04_29515 [Proteobacteria bacterium]|nr:MAG: hypothetical protein EOP04_29515 [Pseudomonadota bacterium]